MRTRNAAFPPRTGLHGLLPAAVLLLAAVGIAQAEVREWTNEDGTTIRGELVFYDLESREITIGMDDGFAFTYPARDLDLKSKLAVMRSPVFVEATGGFVAPYRDITAALVKLAFAIIALYFVVFWISVGLVMNDFSLKRALLCFLKVGFATAGVGIVIGIAIAGFGILRGELPGAPGTAKSAALGGLWIILAVVIWTRGVAESYDEPRPRSFGAFLLFLLLSFALQFVAGLYLTDGDFPGDTVVNAFLTNDILIPLGLM